MRLVKIRWSRRPWHRPCDRGIRHRFRIRCGAHQQTSVVWVGHTASHAALCFRVKGPWAFFDDALKGVSNIMVIELGIASQRMAMIVRGRKGNQMTNDDASLIHLIDNHVVRVTAFLSFRREVSRSTSRTSNTVQHRQINDIHNLIISPRLLRCGLPASEMRRLSQSNPAASSDNGSNWMSIHSNYHQTRFVADGICLWTTRRSGELDGV